MAGEVGTDASVGVPSAVVDDGPRIGGTQMLFLLISAPAAYHVGLTMSSAGGVGEALAGSWFALLVVAVCWGIVVRLELYARRRAREEAERRHTTDPFVREWEARL